MVNIMTNKLEVPAVLVSTEMLMDLTVEQVKEFHLTVLPYFYDTKKAEHMGIDYRYIGYRTMKQEEVL